MNISEEESTLRVLLSSRGLRFSSGYAAPNDIRCKKNEKKLNEYSLIYNKINEDSLINKMFKISPPRKFRVA